MGFINSIVSVFKIGGVGLGLYMIWQSQVKGGKVKRQYDYIHESLESKGLKT